MKKARRKIKKVCASECILGICMCVYKHVAIIIVHNHMIQLCTHVTEEKNKDDTYFAIH